jgi:hypothetical protein
MLLKDENKTLLWGNKEIYIVLTSIRMLLKDNCMRKIVQYSFRFDIAFTNYRAITLYYCEYGI